MDWSAQQAKYGALNQPGQQASVPAPKSGGLTGFIAGAARSIAHPFAELGTAAYNVPATIKREVQNKPVGDIQKRVFGTTDSGSIAKKILGDTAQVGLTAVAPEAGSVLKNAAVGAGYGASSALAQDKSNLSSVLEGGAAGGLTGGAIGIGGKILNKLTGGVEGAVENGASKIASKQAEKETADAAAKAVEEEAPYSAIPKTQRDNSNFQGVRQLFKDKLNMGTDPASFKTAADLTTGESGAFNAHLREMVGDKPVDVGGLLTHVEDAAKTEPLVTTEQGNKAVNFFNKLKQGSLFKGEGSLTDTAGAQDVMDAIQKTDGEIARYNKSTSPGSEGLANIYKQAKGFLEDKLYNVAGVDDAVKSFKLDPESAQSLVEDTVKGGGSPELGQHIVEGINNAQSGQDLRSLQKPFVDANHLADAAEHTQGGVLTKVPKEAAGKGSILNGRNAYYAARATSNPLYAAPLVANVVGDKLSEPLQNVAEKVVGAGQKFNSLPGGTNNILNKVLTTATTTQQPSKPSQPVPTEGYAPVDNTAEAFGTAPDTSSDASSPIFNSDVIQKLVLEDLAKNGGKNVSTLLSLYNTFGKPKEESAADKKATTAAKNAQSTLGSIESSFEAAGGGQGKVGGFLNNLAGKVGLNSNVATYNDTATALAASLYKALGNTGTISDKDQQLISKLIPKTTDTDTTAKSKISQLQSLLQQAQSNLVTQ